MDEQGRFSCERCGKQYKWKPEFAGRKVKCKCGFVMTAPAKFPELVAAGKKQAPDHDDGPNLDALYDLADEGKQAAAAAPAMIRCPHCRNEMEPGQGVCPSCGFDLKTGAKPSRKSAAAATAFGGGGAAAARGASGGGAASGAAPLAAAGGAFAAFGAPRKRGEDLKVVRNDAIIDWYVPIALLALGMVLGALKYSKFSSEIVPIPQALLYAGLILVLGFALVAIAAIFMIQWGEIAFGDPAQAALKIAAAVTAPVFVANIISFWIKDAPPYGWGLVGFFLAFGMFFTYFHYMFEWDMSEKWVVVTVTTGITMLAVPFLFTYIQHGGHLPQAEQNDDQMVSMMDEFGRTKDVRAWMDESKGRILGDFSRTECEDFVSDLYKLGPKSINVVPQGPQAGEMYIRMPSDAKRRKAITDFCNQWMLARHKGGVKDKGGNWLVVVFFAVQHPEPV